MNMDKRQKGFESKFAHDEEVLFKANARRAKLLGLWAAEKLGLSKKDLEAFGSTISNFFDQCNGATGIINATNQTQTNNYDQRELQHQLEKAQLELKLCQAEKEKAEIEARYLREKYEGEAGK